MEVAGRTAKKKFSCEPCEESEKCTKADGFCSDCEEYMCSSCFETHKKWKFNRDHVLSDCHGAVSKRKCSSDFEKCEQHQEEPIKFYCAQHEQIGCGDCMIIDHKLCKVDYISDLANEAVTSDFGSLTKGNEMGKEEAKRVLSSIKNNVVRIDDTNKKFIHDVNMFRDEIITCVNSMADSLLKEAECIKAKDSSSMTNLTKETECVMKDLNVISELFESKMENPNQLFVCSVSKKPKLGQLMKKLNEIKGRNKIETYEFKRDSNLCSIITKSAKLGSLQRNNEIDINDQAKENASVHAKTAVPPKVDLPKTDVQLLRDRILVCRNMKVDGQFLSYRDQDGFGDVGLYVDKKRMENGRYFEIEILSLGRRAIISIGLIPNNYKVNRLPGWKKYSIAYHADDGCLFHEFGWGKPFGPLWQVGDKIGCGIIYAKTRTGTDDVIAFFSRNGKKLGGKKLNTGPDFNLYAAVGMRSTGEKVKVILDAKMPLL